MAETFGRDEGDTIQLTQEDINGAVDLMHAFMTGSILRGRIPIDSKHSRVMLALSISDHHKALLLNHPDAVTHLVAGLFLDPDHPMGLRAKEILGEHAKPTAVGIQQIWQHNYSEALEQLALFPAGREVLLSSQHAVAALEEVAERGMTPEAQGCAAGALVALKGFAPSQMDVVTKHVMLSYQWNSQPMIIKINEVLRRHKYNTWLVRRHESTELHLVIN